MNRNRLAKKWIYSSDGYQSPRLRKYWSDYWRQEIGHGAARVPGRLLASSKLRGARAGRKAGAR